MNEMFINYLNSLTHPSMPTLGEAVSQELERTLAGIRERLPRLTQDFAEHQMVLLSAFLPPAVAQAVGETVLLQASHFDVITATKHGARWSLHMLDDSLSPFQANRGDDLFSAIMLNNEVADVLCGIAQTTSQQLLTTKRWINCYHEGEFITPHVDTTGDFQALLCLSAPPPSHGGEIVLQNRIQLALSPGDLLVFIASNIEHATLPLRSSPLVNNPTRLTGVCRYYLIDGKAPDSRVAIYDSGGNVIGYQSNVSN